MAVEGLSAIAARIAQIHKQISGLTPSRSTTQPPSPLSGTTGTGATTDAAEGSFAAQLASAMRTAGAPGAAGTSGVAGAAVRLTADGVPVDLAKYGNGKIPASALQPLGRGPHRLWAPAAQAFTAMTQAAARDGVSIGVTDSYRSYGEQVDLARRKGLYSQGGLAAKPGTSEHGWGLSLDLDLSSKAQAWMRKHAGEYGFAENVPREPWHWTFKPKA
jgi:D-alanyl-D-alanine carboxypeptidase